MLLVYSLSSVEQLSHRLTLSSIISMITCVKVDFSDPKQGQLVVQLLDGYANDPMGGGEGLKEATKRNLATGKSYF